MNSTILASNIYENAEVVNRLLMESKRSFLSQAP
jgi:hypothetical protein